MVSLKKLPKNNNNATNRALKPATSLRVGATSQLNPILNTDPATHPLQAQVNQFLSKHLPVHQSLLLALSGGLDSCVLLHLLAGARTTFPFKLYAMHVHHGLSANADAWAEFCLQQCQTLNVPLSVEHVSVNRDSKQGVEAEARQMRYSVLFSYKLNQETDVLKQMTDFIVTAHHQDDQAETLILQLLRGAGVKGLSSMASIDKGRRLLRPLLASTRQELSDYAQQFNIEWCHDESNENTQYERNFVRHTLMPVLESRFQSVKTVLARTASHLAEANQLVETLANQDVQPLLTNNSLCVKGLSQLDFVRAKNVLRWWFLQNNLAMPSTEHLNEIAEQLLNAKKDADLSLKIQHLTLKRYRHRAYLWVDKVAEPFDLVWNGEAELTLPNGGRLQFNQVIGAGLALKFGMTKLRISNRDGGERFKPNCLRPTRTLKHLLQEANVPPWQRLHLPLVYWDDTLAFVPHVGVTSELQASDGERGLEIVWQEATI